MKTGICPRCHSTRVYSSAKLRLETGNASSIPLSYFRSISIDNYVCVNCGYVESYVSEPEMLSRIEDIWPQVEPPQYEHGKHAPKDQA